MSRPLRILVNGARGRMGQAILACASRDPSVVVTGTVDVGDDFQAALAGCDVVIEFSHHTVTPGVAAACVATGKRLVIGTTGHTDREREEIREAARHIPVVFSSNYSVGVNALFWLTRRAAAMLGPGFDVEIVEMHHRHKKDAPSGTARRLGEILAETRGLDYDSDTRHGRVGIVGERAASEIGMHALRGGDVVGEHTVIFAASGERVELAHKASSRETFAAGALRAARWILDRSPGLYDMEDVLELCKVE